MQEVNIYLLSDIKGPGRKNTGTYIYVIAMKNPEIKGSVKGIKTVNNTTANQIELMALIEALKRFNRKCSIEIYTDSPYLMAAFNNDWVYGWKANGWKTAAGKEVANRKEWEELVKAVDGYLIRVCELAPVQRNILESEMHRSSKKTNYA